MTSNCEQLELPLRNKTKIESPDMRHQGNLSDRLTVEVECSSLGSNECPSMSSSFSPLDSPTPTPTSIYSQGSLESPGWQGSNSFQNHTYERHTGSTPMRGAFRLGMTSNESMGLPYASMEAQERMPMSEFLGYEEHSFEGVWIPSETPKTYEHATQGLPYPPTMHQYQAMGRNPYRHHPSYMTESAPGPCLSRPIFSQPERIPTSLSMSMMPWMPQSESIPPLTIAPSVVGVGPATPPPSYLDFPTAMSDFKSHIPTTPVRSCSLGTTSGTDTPTSRLSGPGDYQDDMQQSPVYSDAFPRGYRSGSRKVARKQSSKQNLSLENIPAIIRQVQFKCKEPGCLGKFKRQEHLKRHMKSHSKEKPHVCWVPGCHRAFGRSDNLNAHYTKTHSKRGGRNRYVATLDEQSPDYDPNFRGQLTPDGRPIHGSKLEDGSSGDTWQD